MTVLGIIGFIFLCLFAVAGLFTVGKVIYSFIKENGFPFIKKDETIVKGKKKKWTKKAGKGEKTGKKTKKAGNKKKGKKSSKKVKKEIEE